MSHLHPAAARLIFYPLADFWYKLFRRDKRSISMKNAAGDHHRMPDASARTTVLQRHRPIARSATRRSERPGEKGDKTILFPYGTHVGPDVRRTRQIRRARLPRVRRMDKRAAAKEVAAECLIVNVIEQVCYVDAPCDMLGESIAAVEIEDAIARNLTHINPRPPLKRIHPAVPPFAAKQAPRVRRPGAELMARSVG